MNLQISPRELALLLNSGVPPRLLDVRQPEEHAIVALPESRLIPLDELSMRLDELADWKDADLVVYCHHGIRSMHALAILQRHGFLRVQNLSGGIDRWSQEVDPRAPRY
ncbi:MAG: rhodanese-like domain-containing protein [Verrucomicrobiota bacterium]